MEKMAFRCLRLRELHRFLPQIQSGYCYRLSRHNLFNTDVGTSSLVYTNIRGSSEESGFHTQRFSSVAENFHEPLSDANFLSFIKYSLDKPEGPCHRWLNKVENSKGFYRRNAVFLIISGAYIGDFSISGCNPVIMFEKVKALEQRYPSLQVLGFQSSNAICSSATCSHLIHKTMKEYLTFPILLCDKKFSEMADGPCYILFKGFKNPLVYLEKDVDLMIIDKAIKELNMQKNVNTELLTNSKSTWVKPIEFFKEPHLSSPLQNLLLYFPGCISVDESNKRLFLSDINHRRIIVSDHNGEILDCIGSSPGFEDGEFESAKLQRPAASFYHASEDCLYFVDSENHAIRRADMERRILETLYPTENSNKRNSGLLGWIMDKFVVKVDASKKTDEYNSESLLFPWHLMKSLNNIYILNRSFETLWIMDMSSGKIKEVVREISKILEICGEMIQEKSSLLKQIPMDFLQKQCDASCLLVGIPYAGLMSSVASFQDYLVFCDTVGQTVLKLDGESGKTSTFHLSNFGILGIPYWLSFYLEKVYPADPELPRVDADHVQCFSLLPGRIGIKLNVNIPEDTELIEPLPEGCIWRQARGAAIEVSGAGGQTTSKKVGVSQEWYDKIYGLSDAPKIELNEEEVNTTSDKNTRGRIYSKDKSPETSEVGVSQVWYDEIYGLVFDAPKIELNEEEVNTTSDKNIQAGRICIKCAIDTSPGTSEVIVRAALYLRLKRRSNSNENSREKKAARIVDILDPKSEKVRRDGCIHYLLTSGRDLEELIFMKPLHVRLKFECRDHPKEDNGREIILTPSSIAVNVVLK